MISKKSFTDVKTEEPLRLLGLYVPDTYQNHRGRGNLPVVERLGRTRIGSVELSDFTDRARVPINGKTGNLCPTEQSFPLERRSVERNKTYHIQHDSSDLGLNEVGVPFTR